jgi:cell division protein FtsL
MLRIRIIVAALATALMLCALSLVTSQHRARDVFAELEAAQQVGRQNEAEGKRLLAELGRVGQPAAIESGAHELGMRPIDPEHTALLPPAARPTLP